MQKQHYLVVGLGITGLSVVKYLAARNLNFTVTDSRSDPPLLAEFKANFSNIHILLGKLVVPENITTIVLSPGVGQDEPEIQAAKQRGINVIGDIELFAHVVAKPVYAVTGSNGKSTVTTLLGLMAQRSGVKAAVGGNLGTPALDLLDQSAECYILELSSFQLETTYSLHSRAVTLLNVSPDHMDRYVDLKAYQQAKLRIYNHAEYAVFNRADELTFVPAGLSAKTVSFALDQPQGSNFGIIEHSNQKFLAKGQDRLLAVAELGMLGEHNMANALAALAIGELAGFSRQGMLEALREFKGLEHRCEHVLTKDNVVWINDSKGTNVAATVTALSGLANSIRGKWLLILGGVAKNADFTPLVEPIREHCRAVILIGTAAAELMDLLHNVTNCYMAKDLPAVVDLAKKHTQAGDGVLLSPACASFDMFDNYMHRGKLFKQEVLQRIDQQHVTAITT